MSDAELEFWLMKIGADGLVRITRRPSGEGITGSWVSANEAERLVLAEWGFNPRLPLNKIEGLRDHLVALRRSCTAFNWDAKKDAIMIIGKTNIDYFVILCEKCGSTTKNEYLGTDPMMPRFKATCPKCGDLGAFKLDAIDWSGLPPEPSTS